MLTEVKSYNHQVCILILIGQLSKHNQNTVDDMNYVTTLCWKASGGIIRTGLNLQSHAHACMLQNWLLTKMKVSFLSLLLLAAMACAFAAPDSEFSMAVEW